MAFKVYLDGWEPQTRFPLAPANQCMVSAMINAFNLSPHAARLVTEGPFPKLIVVEPALRFAQRGIKIIVEAGGTVHMVDDSKPYSVYLDGWERRANELRPNVIRGLKEVFEFSDLQCQRATEGDFPKLLGTDLTEDQASVAVRRLAIFGAFARAVNDDLEPREIVWERLMRD